MESGLVSGFSAVVPTDDYWRAKNEQAARRREQIQLGTAEQRRRDAERKRQEQEMKDLGKTYGGKVHPLIRKDYEAKQDADIKSLFDIAIREGTHSPTIYEKERAIKNREALYGEKGLSKTLYDFDNEDPSNLNEYGKALQGIINTYQNEGWDKVKSEYAKRYPEASKLVPLEVSEVGTFNKAPFIADKTDYLKGLKEAKPTEGRILETETDPISGNRFQNVEYTVPIAANKRPTDPMNTVEGYIRTVLAHDEKAYAKYATEHATELVKSIEKIPKDIRDKMTPEEKIDAYRTALGDILIKETKTKVERARNELGRGFKPSTSGDGGGGSKKNDGAGYYDEKQQQQQEAKQAAAYAYSNPKGGSPQQAATNAAFGALGLTPPTRGAAFANVGIDEKQKTFLGQDDIDLSSIKVYNPKTGRTYKFSDYIKMFPETEKHLKDRWGNKIKGSFTGEQIGYVDANGNTVHVENVNENTYPNSRLVTRKIFDPSVDWAKTASGAAKTNHSEEEEIAFQQFKDFANEMKRAEVELFTENAIEGDVSHLNKVRPDYKSTYKTRGKSTVPAPSTAKPVKTKKYKGVDAQGNVIYE